LSPTGDGRHVPGGGRICNGPGPVVEIFLMLFLGNIDVYLDFRPWEKRNVDVAASLRIVQQRWNDCSCYGGELGCGMLLTFLVISSARLSEGAVALSSLPVSSLELS